MAATAKRLAWILSVALAHILGTRQSGAQISGAGTLRGKEFLLGDIIDPTFREDITDTRLHTCSSGIGLSERQIEDVHRRKCRVLCELKGGEGGCTELFEPCMGLQRSRHAQKLQSLPTADWGSLSPKPATTVSSEDVAFVVFFAVGKRNAEAYPNHQYVDPDTNFIPVLRKTHPGARIVILSDEHTPFAPDIGVEIFRVSMDSDRLGRNAYANYYQYLGQQEFLRSLKEQGSQQHVVFMDMDVLVLDSILEIFCSDYGYGLTINANEYDPIDIGLQFVQATHYEEGIAFLKELTDRYLDLIGHPNSFTTGQVVMRNTLELGHKDVMIPKIATTATKNNIYCRTVQNGKHRICFFPCMRYNFWEDCTHTVGQLLPQDPALYREHGTKIMQFVAWRKPGLEVVAKAFLQDGIEGAFSAFAALPHTEADYKKQFDFNTNVTKICYKDDNGCFGTKMSDESTLWTKPQK